MRYFLEIAYNGIGFHGWQIQPNAISVQETLETTISIITGQKITVTGAGRTDTGVHARRMYGHFDVDKEICNEKKFLLSLNSMVGKNILIKDIKAVDSDSHARFDAVERTYKYFVAYSDNPFLKDLFWKSHSNLDIEAMNEAAALLIDTKDFTSFAKLHSDSKTNICDVRKAEWKKIEDDTEAKEFIGNLNNGIVFTISADRFLRNMVRAVVGTLVEVGRGKITLDQFQQIISQKNRCCAGTSMPAHALYLWDIKYPFAL